MGTTAQKLEYLGTTKSQLKDMINYGLPTENQITNETTFRNYVKSIFEAFIESLRDSTTLYTNLPKISGNGTQITLNDTANAPMRITLKANELTQDGTPTPDNPQDIHTISGDNSVVVEGKNFLDNSVFTSGYNVNSINNQVIQSKTLGAYNILRVGCNSITIIGGTQYYATFKARRVSGNGTLNTYFRLYDGANYTVQNSFNDGITEPTISSDFQTFCYRFHNDTDFTGNSIVLQSSSSASSLVIEIKDLIISKTANDTYEPYVSQTSPINLDTLEYCKIGNYKDEFILTSGKNLLPVTNQDYTINGVNFKAQNGSIIVNGTASANITGFLVRTDDYFPITLEAGTYHFSRNRTNLTVGLIKANSQAPTVSLSNSSTATSTTFTLTETTKLYFFFYMASGTTINNEAWNIMVSKEDTDYEPYGTNQWYLKKNIGKVVLDGSETWNERTNAGGIKQFYGPTNLPINSVLNATQICTHFSNYVQNLFNYGGVGQFAILTNTRQFFAGVEDTLLLEDFKTLLASNNLIVYYILATPTYTQITGTLETQLTNIREKMLSYKGTTNVSQINNDLPFVLGVSAIQDLE